jgi:hypothetical protein
VNKKQIYNLQVVLFQVCSRQLPVTDIFVIILLRVRRYEKSQFKCLITSLLLLLEQKKYCQCIGSHTQRIRICTHIWPLTYISRSNQGHDAYFWLKMYMLVYVVIIKLIFCMNDRFNTCNIIHIHDLTLTFISRSYLGQVHLQGQTFITVKIFKTVINDMIGSFWPSTLYVLVCDLTLVDMVTPCLW